VFTPTLRRETILARKEEAKRVIVLFGGLFSSGAVPSARLVPPLSEKKNRNSGGALTGRTDPIPSWKKPGFKKGGFNKHKQEEKSVVRKGRL